MYMNALSTKNIMKLARVGTCRHGPCLRGILPVVVDLIDRNRLACPKAGLTISFTNTPMRLSVDRNKCDNRVVFPAA